MKNREKFAKEILDIACNGDTISVTKDNKIVCCDHINCGKCLFYKTDDYGRYCDDEEPMKWSESEYIEKPKYTITSKEKAFLDLLLPEWKYIARDNDCNRLFLYTDKPSKKSTYWLSETKDANTIRYDVFDVKFDFIKWDDKEPWSIEDLKKLEVRDEK